MKPYSEVQTMDEMRRKDPEAANACALIVEVLNLNRVDPNAAMSALMTIASNLLLDHKVPIETMEFVFLKSLESLKEEARKRGLK